MVRFARSGGEATLLQLELLELLLESIILLYVDIMVGMIGTIGKP